VPRCGALSLLQKTLHYRGYPAETAAGLNAKFWNSVVLTGGELPGFWNSRANPLFEYIWTFENNFEYSPKDLAREFRPGSLGRVKWYHFCEGQCAPSPRWLRRGDVRHRLKHVATRLPPAGPHTDFLCRNRRRHKNHSNLRQCRLGSTSNDTQS
jgi:hypothetical protein